MARKRSIIIHARYFLEYTIFRLLEAAICCVPARWIDVWGCWLGSCAYHLLPSRRKTVIRNLRIVLSGSTQNPDIELLARETFRRTGANLLGGIRCMMMSEKELVRHVSLEGAELVRDTLKSHPHGAIFVLSHMGNWEILARITDLISPRTPAGAFYRPLNNPWMNRMQRKRRQQSGTELFSKNESFTRACKLLRDGGMLGILSDQNAGRSGCLAAFFGRPTSCSPLPELLQRRTGAAMFYISMCRDAPAHWHIHITQHPESEPCTTRHIMHRVEKALLLSPVDGFWMHDRWKLSYILPFHRPQSRQDLDATFLSAPWRYVIVISANAAIASAAAPAIRHLIASLPLEEIHQLTATPDMDLTQALEELDRDKPYPLDFVIYFCPALADQAPHRATSIPLAAGFGVQNTALKCCVRPPSSAMDDPQTWFHFIQSLGCPAPNNTP